MKKVFTIIAVLIFSKMSTAQHIQGTSDTAAIHKILNSFAQSIIKKDSATLASLFANTPIAFLSVRGAETVAYLKKKDPSTPFIQIRNYKDFRAYVAQTKNQLEEKFYNVGLLGTKFTMENSFFKDQLTRHGIETIIPSNPDKDYIHNSIFNEFTKGIFSNETKRKYLDIISQLQIEGAEAIVLGCTEISLLINQSDCKIRLFDTAAIHSKAAVDFALS